MFFFFFEGPASQAVKVPGPRHHVSPSWYMVHIASFGPNLWLVGCTNAQAAPTRQQHNSSTRQEVLLFKFMPNTHWRTVRDMSKNKGVSS
eukprot:1139287-Pelagomonas_calceolata.AAC.3